MSAVKLSRRARWMRILAVSFLTALIISIVSVVAIRHIYNQDLKPVAAGQKTVIVTIPTGYLTPQIAKLLKQDGVIRSEWAFKQYVKNTQADDVIKAGTYDLSPSYSTQEIVTIITQGKIKTNLLTILPGQTLDQIKSTFIHTGFDKSQVEQALNPTLYKNHPALVDKPADASLEGYLYPDSYQKDDNTTPQQIITLALDEMQQHLTPALRQAIAKQNLSVFEGIIVASIAEKEADTASDRAQVAQVILTRIRQGMNLQLDTTAFYGAALNNQPLSINYDSAYNTYLHPGLPIGPISNVSNSSLQAVAQPANTNWLYFVAGDDHAVHFAQTAQEHQAQVDEFCKKLCSNSQ